MPRWPILVAAFASPWAVSRPADAADPAPAWIFFHDKGPALAARLDDALSARSASLAPRALTRRQRARNDGGLDARDLDVWPAYLDALAAAGARPRATSRWLNAVSVTATPDVLDAIARRPEVRAIQAVARRARDVPWRGVSVRADDLPIPLNGGPERYGVAIDQLAMLGIPDLRGCGLDGSGVVVAVLDSGFTLGHSALTHIDVLAQRDFVKGDDVVSDEANDVPGQHDHGTSVLGLLAGQAPGSYMGAAPAVTVILAKTEDISFEQPIEEDWFVAGLEWAEGLGADMATASLGYFDWYEQADLDGKTAVTTIAANIAMENGLVMVAAAGNAGPEPTTIGAPADADRLIAVGAVAADGVVTDFSSRGPTADGRIKPDVSARGQDDWVVVPGSTDQYQQGNGTSYAAPLVAGVVAMLKQAYPALGAAEMQALLTSTATQAGAPGNAIGYGIVRGYDAAGLYCTCHDVDADGAFDVACGGTDCDDDAAAVLPGATEACNGIDDDCDGALGPGEDDADGDGELACAGDCDDGEAAMWSGASEDCGDGLDNDCDGDTDGADDDCADPNEATGAGASGAAQSEPAALTGGCGCRSAGRTHDGGLMALAMCALAVWRRRRRPGHDARAGQSSSPSSCAMAIGCAAKGSACTTSPDAAVRSVA
ncbi:MAG: S8 family serine peptidase [Polyangiaceae bacterium]